MAETKKVILDAGHGGTTDPGAVYQGRQEKNDNLRMALAVGQILSENGVDVGYTRVQDVYQSPLQKAQMANNWEADYFVSFHRNAMPVPGTASGTESLIFSRGGETEQMASNINAELGQAGWNDLGTTERPGLIVLRKQKCLLFWWRVDFWTIRKITSGLMCILSTQPGQSLTGS